MSDTVAYEVFADFSDGQSALLQRAGVALSTSGLRIGLPSGSHIDWPLAELRAQPDQAESTSLVLGRAGDPVSRLFVTDADMIAQIRTAAPKLRRRPPIENKGRILGWGAGAIASVTLIIFVLVPLMADQLARYLPAAGERALGDATFEQIRRGLGEDNFQPVGVCENRRGLVALAKMRIRLNAESGLPYPLIVTVLDHDLVNAFALPGGRIIIFRGLLEEAQSAEEVAAVLAHEIGHVVARDPTRDALRLAGSVGVLGLLFGDFAGGTAVLFLANQLINAQYSQQAEAGADDFAHAALTDAGLPPAALGTFFERLRDEYGDAEGLAAHFASHPQMTARIESALAAQERAAGAGRVGDPVLSASEWAALRNICGPAGSYSLPGGGIKIIPDQNGSDSTSLGDKKKR